MAARDRWSGPEEAAPDGDHLRCAVTVDGRRCPAPASITASTKHADAAAVRWHCRWHHEVHSPTVAAEVIEDLERHPERYRPPSWEEAVLEASPFYRAALRRPGERREVWLARVRQLCRDLVERRLRREDLEGGAPVEGPEEAVGVDDGARSEAAAPPPREGEARPEAVSGDPWSSEEAAERALEALVQAMEARWRQAADGGGEPPWEEVR